jgi:predicted ester cyclase
MIEGAVDSRLVRVKRPDVRQEHSSVGVEENKSLIRQLFEAQGQPNIENTLTYWAPDVRNHGVPVGLQGMRAVFESLLTAFPDRKWEIVDLIAEGDRVVARLQISGTHQGTPALPIEGGARLQRITPTGRAYNIQHIHIFRIVDGKIAEHWAAREDLELLEQLGGLEPL